MTEHRDWGDIRQLARWHHACTVFADLPFSERKFDALETEAKTPAAHRCLLVAESRGLVGMALVSAGEYVLSEGGLMTTTELLAVDAERCRKYLSAKVFLRLVRGIVLWPQSRKSSHVLVHVATGTAIKATDRLLQAAGAICIAGGYRIAVPGR